MIILKHVGRDGWSREVYQDINTKKLYCDINLLPPYDINAYIHTKYKGFEGEPDYPIKKDSYKFIDEALR